MERFKQLIEKGVLPKFSTFANPCDITGSGDTKSYIEATKTVLEDESFDMVVVIALYHPPEVKMNLAEKLCNLVEDYRKPVVMTNFGSAEAGQVMRQKFNNNGIPAYPTPERGMRALSTLFDYGQYLKKEDELNKYLKNYKKPKV